MHTYTLLQHIHPHRGRARVAGSDFAVLSESRKKTISQIRNAESAQGAVLATFESFGDSDGLYQDGISGVVHAAGFCKNGAARYIQHTCVCNLVIHFA
jgi:hypothetical protein